MKKRLLSGLLIVVLLLTMLPVGVLAEELAPVSETMKVTFRGQDAADVWYDEKVVDVEVGSLLTEELLTEAAALAVARRGEGIALDCWTYEVSPSQWVVFDPAVPVTTDMTSTGELALYANYKPAETEPPADDGGDGDQGTENPGETPEDPGQTPDPVTHTVSIKRWEGNAWNECWTTISVADGETVSAADLETLSETVYADVEGVEFLAWTYQKNGVWTVFTEETVVTGPVTVFADYKTVEEEEPEPTVTYYVIEAEDGRNGDISPEGYVYVEEGENQTFRFYPDRGYEVSAVYVDGYLINYYGICYDHHWTCKGCSDCWWIDWSKWYDCDHIWCEDHWCDYYAPCTWYDWQDGITFYDVDEDHTLYVEFAPVDAECPSEAYWDLDTDAWYHAATDYVIEHDLMEGVGGSTFDPYGATTRAQLVTMLYRLAGEPRVSGGSGYADVPADAWYTNAVIWASNKGIVEGYGNGYFGVNDVVTREQTVTILYRYAKYTGCDVRDLASLKHFLDVEDVSDFALKPFGWAVEEDIVEGKPAGSGRVKLEPQGTTARVEMAAVLMRYAEYVG